LSAYASSAPAKGALPRMSAEDEQRWFERASDVGHGGGTD
jgi:hypothetical protein